MPTVVTCASPSVPTLSVPVHSLVPPIASLGFPGSSLVPPVAHLSSVASVSGSSLAPSDFPGDLWSSPYVSAGAASSSAFGFSHSAGLRVSFGSIPGTSDVFGSIGEVPLNYTDVDDSSDEDDKESPSLGKGEFSKSFQEVISLITGFFPHSKSSVASSSDELIPWLDVFGNTRHRSPRVFLNFFDKLSTISKEIEKFDKVADDKKKASSAFHHWGEVYCLGDMEKFHKAPKINESFTRLLNKPVSTSRYVSLSLDDCQTGVLYPW